MGKFCGKCGSPLDKKTGLCPNCDMAKLLKIYLDELRKRRIKVILSIFAVAIVMTGLALWIISDLRNSTMESDVKSDTASICTYPDENAMISQETIDARKKEISVPYFEEKGWVCNMTELNKPYDYHTRSREDASIPVNGKLVVTDYETYPSDETHEALEEYEWRRVRFKCIIPLSEMENGGLITFFTSSFYEKKENKDDDAVDGIQYPFTVKWNGTKYTDGIIELAITENTYLYESDFLYTDCWLCIWELNVRVPIGYDGVVFITYNRTPKIEALMESEMSITDAVLSDDDTLSFRLD